MRITESYASQSSRWPESGRHILAQFDDSTIVVYQAYRPAIGRFAAEHGYFGGEFSYARMSWIKPNFLWMMFRSGWGTKPGQEVTLAVRITRAGFDEILRCAVPSSRMRESYGTYEAWKKAISRSEVRLQWDPDHDPTGAPVERRAIQLGLRGEVLRRYGREWIVEIVDVSGFVAEQRAKVGQSALITPREEVYPITDEATRRTLGMI